MGINSKEPPESMPGSVRQLLHSLNRKLYRLDAHFDTTNRLRLLLTIFIFLVFPLIGLGLWLRGNPAASAPASSLPSVINGKGILMNQVGRLFTLNTRVDGVVKNINVQMGDFVKKEQVVVEILDHQYEIKLASALAREEEAKRDLEILKKDIALEGTALQKSYQQQLNTDEYTIEQQDKKIEHISEDLAKKKLLLEQKLVSFATVRDVEDQLSAAKVERESMKASVADLRYNLTRGYRKEDLKAKQDEHIAALVDLNLLKFQKKYYQVKSPYDGYVLELQVGPGYVVNRGQSLVVMERCNGTIEECFKGNVHLLVFSFISIDQGKLIAIGDRADIAVSSVDSVKYGTLAGKVTQVTRFPVSFESIVQLLFNRDLVTYLVGTAGPVFVATIEPDVDPATKNYQWSSGLQPPYPLTSGTVCNVTITPSKI